MKEQNNLPSNTDRYPIVLSRQISIVWTPSKAWSCHGSRHLLTSTTCDSARDLVALSTLTAVWTNYGPSQIANSVAADASALERTESGWRNDFPLHPRVRAEWRRVECRLIGRSMSSTMTPPCADRLSGCWTQPASASCHTIRHRHFSKRLVAYRPAAWCWTFKCRAWTDSQSRRVSTGWG